MSTGYIGLILLVLLWLLTIYTHFWRCHLLASLLILIYQVTVQELKIHGKCMGTSYGTFSGSIVCHLSLNTTGSYSLTFILHAKVFFATLTFQHLPLQWKISLKMYRDLLWYLFWLYFVPITFKHNWNLFSDIYSLCKGVFCYPYFPILANTMKNQFENV